MKSRRFIQCDVFSPLPTQGNALAVVVDGDGLSEEQMRRFSAWTNLAETTSLLPADDLGADYRVRIFTPVREMPFAGHPTLGSCAAWLDTGGIPREPGVVRQECAVGIVDIETGQEHELAFRAPPTAIRPMSVDKFEAIVAALEIPRDVILRTAELDNGPTWQVLELVSAENRSGREIVARSLADIQGNRTYRRTPPGSGVRLRGAHAGALERHERGSDYRLLELRYHALDAGRGSASRTDYAQGTAIGRRGRVSIRLGKEKGAILVGGQTHILIRGTVAL